MADTIPEYGVTFSALETRRPIIPTLTLYLRVLEYWVSRNPLTSTEVKATRTIGLFLRDPIETDPVCSVLQQAYQQAGVLQEGSVIHNPYLGVFSPWRSMYALRTLLSNKPRWHNSFCNVVHETCLIIAVPSDRHSGKHLVGSRMLAAADQIRHHLRAIDRLADKCASEAKL